ncbi:hypothetical protein PLCT1_01941 [Planctomycetaceae bacterium]|nr:hypothetical protein PLCT1_01941 [Planctomycetaceae bacterium]
MQDGNEALRARISQLVAEHTQAKVARETQSTPSTISRYLAGMKIPAEFCSRLVAKLGVNPAWLLSGEGAVYLADVKAATVGHSQSMLELVQAMGAISKAKLGALMGRADRKTLRELSDAMTAFERLQEQLSSKTRGFLTDILEQLRKTLEARDYAQGEYLCTVARQASRFCHDEQLHRALDHYEADLRSSQRKDESALALQRASIMRYLVIEEPTELALSEIRSHVSYLMRTGRLEQALRTAKAALVLAEGGRNEPDYQFFIHVLRVAEGMLNVLLGRVREGAAMAFAAANLMGPENEQYFHLDVVLCELFLGLRDVDSVLAEHQSKLKQGRVEVVVAGAATVMTMAFLLEDAALIRRASDFYSGNALIKGRIGAVLPAFADAFCELARHKRAEQTFRDYLVSEAHKVRLGSESPVDHFRAHETACQLARVGGLRKQALAEFEATDDLLKKLPKRFQIPVLQLAVHQRNALKLFSDERADSGRKWLEERVRDGFGGLRPLLA